LTRQGLRTELTAAWRSLRYDIDRWRARRASAEVTTELVFPENARPAPRRRLLATAGFGAFAVVSAVGTYFGVVNGLGAILAPEAAAQEAPPAAVAGAAGTGSRPADPAPPGEAGRTARSGGPLTDAGRQAATGHPGGGGTGDGAPPAGGGDPGPVPPTGHPIPEESRTPAPPAPTATASPTPSPSPAPTGSDPTGSPAPTATPQPSGPEQTPDGSWSPRRHQDGRP